MATTPDSKSSIFTPREPARIIQVSFIGGWILEKTGTATKLSLAFAGILEAAGLRTHTGYSKDRWKSAL